jgi:ferredoxin
MANPKLRVPENLPGDFFVDSTCIDCDTCRQIAPRIFGEAAQFAFVRQQPHSIVERRSALHALVSCPTGSIGSLGGDSPKTVTGDFPLLVEESVERLAAFQFEWVLPGHGQRVHLPAAQMRELLRQLVKTVR